MFIWWHLVIIIVVVTFIITCIVLAIMDRKGNYYTSDDYVMYSIISVICILVVVGIIAGISHGNLINNAKEYEKICYENKTEVLTLQNSTSTEMVGDSSFILGFGSTSVKSSEVANYYTVMGNKKDGYVLTKCDAYETYLFFDENISPYAQDKVVYEITEYKENWIFGGLIKPIKTKKEIQSCKKQLHIPENTLKVEYKIDFSQDTQEEYSNTMN